MQFAKRMSRVQASAIREILKVAERPDVLSFAGGLPAPEAFPAEALARAHADVLSHDAAAALQYGATEGFGPLRAWVAERMTRRGLPATPEALQLDMPLRVRFEQRGDMSLPVFGPLDPSEPAR